MQKISKILTIFIVIIISLNIWGALFPSHYNWGFHTFAFYPPLISIIAGIIALLILIPKIQLKISNLIENFIKPFSKLPLPLIFLLLSAILILIAFTFPVKGLLLGDSKIILLTTPELPTSTDESANFRNQPLVLLTLRFLSAIVQKSGTEGLKEIYKWFDITGGLLFTFFLIIFIKKLETKSLEAFLLGIFIFSAAGSQLFFGYIENYALLYAFTAGFFVTSWLSIKENLHPVFPILIFISMMGLHLGAIVYIPVLMIILISSYRKNKLSIIILLIITAIAVISIFFFTNYSINQLLIRLRDAYRYDILPFFKPIKGIPYTIFSPLHLITWMNLILLIAPFGLIPLLILLLTRMKSIVIEKYEWILLSTITACGIIFTFIINPALGMFRDWDMLSSFFVPMIFLTAVAFYRALSGLEKRQILTAMVVLSLIHGSFFFGINADEDRHLKRAEVLTNPLFLGQFAQKLLYDRLANIAWDRGEYEKSKFWYKKYLTIDSTNPRIVANIAEVYARLKDIDNEFLMLKRSAELGSKNPAVYSNIGVKYFKKNDIENAISSFKKALALDSMHAISHANIGLCYTLQKKHHEANVHLEKAVGLGMIDAPILNAIGDNYVAVENPPRAINYYKLYLRLQPTDTVVQNRLHQLIKYSKLRNSKDLNN